MSGVSLYLDLGRAASRLALGESWSVGVPARNLSGGPPISYANTRNLQTWFQSKLHHVFLHTTKKDRPVK